MVKLTDLTERYKNWLDIDRIENGHVYCSPHIGQEFDEAIFSQDVADYSGLPVICEIDNFGNTKTFTPSKK